MQLNDIEKSLLTDAISTYTKEKDPIVQALGSQVLSRILDPVKRKPKAITKSESESKI